MERIYVFFLRFILGVYAVAGMIASWGSAQEWPPRAIFLVATMASYLAYDHEVKRDRLLLLRDGSRTPSGAWRFSKRAATEDMAIARWWVVVFACNLIGTILLKGV